MNPAERSVLREGIVAGLIGAAVVAIWFFVFDLLRGRPFLTPTLLGSLVFFGVNTPAGLDPAAGPIIGYTILHGLAFVAFGVVAATMMAMSEREPALFIAFVILFAAFEVFFFGVLSVLGRGMQTVLVWWSVLIGNLLASVAMLWYFFRAHRALPRSLIGSWGRVLREGIVAGIIGAAVVALWFFGIAGFAFWEWVPLVVATPSRVRRCGLRACSAQPCSAARTPTPPCSSTPCCTAWPSSPSASSARCSSRAPSVSPC